MGEPEKPTRGEDVAAPFERIGEPGWADSVRALLASYGAPPPSPVSEVDVSARETELGVLFPDALRVLITQLGPLDLDIRLLGLDEIRLLDQVWFRDKLPPEQQGLLPRLLAVADYGSGDYVALDVGSGRCGVLGHDPPGLWKPLLDLDTLIKVMLMRLPAGYYGWPDEAVAGLVEAAVEALVGFNF